MKEIILILLVMMNTATTSLADEHSFEAEPVQAEEFAYTEESENTEESTYIGESADLAESINAEENLLSEKISEINLIQDDEEKIKEWARFNSAKNFVIINKKQCSATVYDEKCLEIKTFEVGIGKDIGDDFNDTSGLLGKSKNTTPAGEYTLITNITNISNYGDLTLSLGKKANSSEKAKKVVALHKIPKFRQKDRLDKFYDENLSNNRMSHGCINFVEDDFKELVKYIQGGTKVYVLPEEADNQLMLTRNDKDEFELAQTKYKKN